MKLNNKNITLGIVTSLLLTACIGEKTNNLVHEIIDPELNLCTEETHLYYPNGYPHLPKLKEFKTCVSPLTIIVLDTGDLKVIDSSGTWIGSLTSTGSIQHK